jgi:hypothetical protein
MEKKDVSQLKLIFQTRDLDPEAKIIQLKANSKKS